MAADLSLCPIVAVGRFGISDDEPCLRCFAGASKLETVMRPEVLDFLTITGVNFKVHSHPRVISVEDARAVLPFEPRAMVKGLVFRTPDGSYAIVGMRGADRADYKKIADALGIRRADLTLASPEQLASDLKMQAGGVVPLPIHGAKVLIDRSVEGMGIIFCGAGSNDATLELESADLIRIAQGRTGDFVKGR